MLLNRIIGGPTIIWAMVCGFVLGGFAPPAVAKIIVVTTLADIADSPFNADGLCGTGTINDLPGADGQISLREAIIAANNTLGEDVITFAPSLSGGVLTVNFDDLDADTAPDPLPTLCGGQTRLNGDLNDDGVPDITLEGAVFPIGAAAGIQILSSHNTVNGLQIQHFPFGIRIRAGDFTTQGTVTHTTVTNNTLVEAKLDGIAVTTGNIPNSSLAHTILAHNLAMHNARYGILVSANISAAGSGTQIQHTTITDNEVRGNGAYGIFLFVFGDHNVFNDIILTDNKVKENEDTGIGLLPFGDSNFSSNVTLAHNTVSENAFGMNLTSGFGGAEENSFEVHIENNIVADNTGGSGIRVLAGQDNSSHNHMVAWIVGNTAERNRFSGIEALAGEGANAFPAGASNQNVLDVEIARNIVRQQTGAGIYVVGGAGGTFPAGSADNNRVSAVLHHNTVEANTVEGLGLFAGGPGQVNGNTVEVWVAQNTVCHNGADIVGEGGFTGNSQLPVPASGTGNELTGGIFQNTTTTLTITDGIPGNTATVTQLNNKPCP